MAGARHKDFSGGARGRLFARLDAEPEQLWRLVWHRHLFGEGSSDGSDGNMLPELDLGPLQTWTFRRAGHNVPVHFTWLRDGVTPEEFIMPASASAHTISAGAGFVTSIAAGGI